MSPLILILLILLLLGAFGSLPTWGYAQSWGYGPSGLLGVALVILLILFLIGKI